MKVIDWIVFLTLTIVALVSVEASFEAYANAKTTWIAEQRPITSQPTFVLCVGLSAKTYYYYTLHPIKDYNITLLPNSKR